MELPFPVVFPSFLARPEVPLVAAVGTVVLIVLTTCEIKAGRGLLVAGRMRPASEVWPHVLPVLRHGRLLP